MLSVASGVSRAAEPPPPLRQTNNENSSRRRRRRRRRRESCRLTPLSVAIKIESHFTIILSASEYISNRNTP